MSKNVRNTIILIAVPLVLILAVMLVVGNVNAQEKTTYYQIVEKFDAGKIEKFTLNMTNGRLEYWEVGESKSKVYDVPSVQIFYEEVGQKVAQKNAEATAHNLENPDDPIPLIQSTMKSVRDSGLSVFCPLCCCWPDW